MSVQHNGPLYFHDVEVGEQWQSPARTVTEADVVNFAGLTGDYNPLHVDREFARNTPFGKPIAHGLLGLSLVAGLASYSPWMCTAAFLGITGWRFLRPIYIGDTVRVSTLVVAKELKGRGRRGLITWRRQLINQAGAVVQEGTTESLVDVRPERVESNR
jgi:3-hydroxybutyryl-CoA dehydratase